MSAPSPKIVICHNWETCRQVIGPTGWQRFVAPQSWANQKSMIVRKLCPTCSAQLDSRSEGFTAGGFVPPGSLVQSPIHLGDSVIPSAVADSLEPHRFQTFSCLDSDSSSSGSDSTSDAGCGFSSTGCDS